MGALAAAIRKDFPDISQAPANIRAQLERMEKPSTMSLADSIKKASDDLGNAQAATKSLQTARAAHKQRWLKHLQDSVLQWKEMLESYDTQNRKYEKLMQEAVEKEAASSQLIEELNAKAGKNAKDEISSTAMDVPTDSEADVQERALRERVQDTLTACLAAVDAPIMIESESKKEGQPVKRARSKDRDQGEGDAGNGANGA